MLAVLSVFFLPKLLNPAKNISYLGRMDKPRAVRNNNPINLIISNNAWKGKISVQNNTDGRFEQFQKLWYGTRAAIINSRTQYNKGANTIYKLVSSIAPSGDGNNNPALYAKTVSDRTGISENSIFLWNRPTVKKILKAVSFVESGYNTIPDSVFNYAWDRV